MSIHVIGVFCEDIREEKSGQVTLVGIFLDNLTLSRPPADVSPQSLRPMLPKLGLYVRVHLGFEDDPGPMKLKLVLEDSSEIDLGTISDEIIAKSKEEASAKRLPFAGIVSNVVLSPFQIPVLGKVIAIVETRDQRYSCGILNFVSGVANS